MSKQSIALAFRQYIWLADVIYSAGRITREDINRKWRDNSLVNPDETLEIPERTFHNWKHAIEDLFELSIECDHSTGKYYIENVDQMDKNGVRTWLVNTFAITDMMAGAKQIKSQILFEYKLVPNYEFRLELRQHLSAIEILAPKYLRDEMRDEAKKLLEMYE